MPAKSLDANAKTFVPSDVVDSLADPKATSYQSEDKSLETTVEQTTNSEGRTQRKSNNRHKTRNVSASQQETCSNESSENKHKNTRKHNQSGSENVQPTLGDASEVFTNEKTYDMENKNLPQKHGTQFTSQRNDHQQQPKCYSQNAWPQNPSETFTNEKKRYDMGNKNLPQKHDTQCASHRNDHQQQSGNDSRGQTPVPFRDDKRGRNNFRQKHNKGPVYQDSSKQQQQNITLEQSQTDYSKDNKRRGNNFNQRSDEGSVYQSNTESTTLKQQNVNLEQSQVEYSKDYKRGGSGARQRNYKEPVRQYNTENTTPKQQNYIKSHNEGHSRSKVNKHIGNYKDNLKQSQTESYKPVSQTDFSNTFHIDESTNKPSISITNTGSSDFKNKTETFNKVSHDEAIGFWENSELSGKKILDNSDYNVKYKGGKTTSSQEDKSDDSMTGFENKTESSNGASVDDYAIFRRNNELPEHKKYPGRQDCTVKDKGNNWNTGSRDNWRTADSEINIKDRRSEPGINSNIREKDFRRSDPRILRQNKELFDKRREKDDTEFEQFIKEYGKNLEFEYKKVIEKDQDLFQMPKDYALAHCVAEDMRMGSGIAVYFKREFKDLGTLLSQKQKQGGLAVLEDQTKECNRYIYYLVTKKVSTGKPTYETFWSSLKKMRDHLKEHEVKKLAIPRIGCGLDRLEWTTVKYMLEFLFTDMEIEIVVCNFQQNEDVTPQKSYTCKVVEVTKSIVNIESETIIIYFSTENGDVSDEMRQLNEKFSFLDHFKRTSKKLGEAVRFEDNKNIYMLYGCIVRKTIKDEFYYQSFDSCLRQINKLNKKDGYVYVGVSVVNDTSDYLVHQKILTLMMNTLRNVDIYVCADTDDKKEISNKND